MRVFGILFDNCAEIFDGLFVVVNHLIGLGALMDVPHVSGVVLDRRRIRENRLFELVSR